MTDTFHIYVLVFIMVGVELVRSLYLSYLSTRTTCDRFMRRVRKKNRFSVVHVCVWVEDRNAARVRNLVRSAGCAL